jgi:hypothetical protein
MEGLKEKLKNAITTIGCLLFILFIITIFIIGATEPLLRVAAFIKYLGS